MRAERQRERTAAALEIVYMSGLMGSLQALEEAASSAAIAAADVPPALAGVRKALAAGADQARPSQSPKTLFSKIPAVPARRARPCAAGGWHAQQGGEPLFTF